MKLFENILPATFLARPNRFVLNCELRGRTVSAYLPNPGRLWELLFPGTTVHLTRFPPSSERKLKYLCVAVERDSMPIMLHTHHTNTVAAHLIRNDRIPGLEGAEIVQAEYRIGHSRFDFLLRKDGKDILLEVKSCTLVNDTLAMFPDAVSARATKHIEELAHLSRKGYRAAVLFVVHWPKARWFMPEHHTDLAFSRALYTVRDRVMVKAVAVGWTRDLTLQLEEPEDAQQDNPVSRQARKERQGDGQRHESLISASQQETGHSVSPLRPPRARLEAPTSGCEIECPASGLPFSRELTIPWDLVDRESHDRGCYIIVLRLPRDKRLGIGSLGKVMLRKGYYCYVGSAMKDLAKRIERHRRLTKKFHWHIDHLREQAEFVAAIPIRTSEDLECKLAGSLREIAEWTVPGFGSSDCSCPAHLFGMQSDPVHTREFSKLLLGYRMGRYEEELHEGILPRMNTDRHG